MTYGFRRVHGETTMPGDLVTPAGLLMCSTKLFTWEAYKHALRAPKVSHHGELLRKRLNDAGVERALHEPDI